MKHIENNEQIRVLDQPNGRKVVCYIFMDSKTFPTPESRECRGIAFDANGRIVSRPLHKFFNMGEKAELMPEKLLERAARGELAGIYDKIDGSMVSTSYSHDDGFAWRSKKSYVSDTVRAFEREVPKNIADFARVVAASDHTATFEFVDPESQVVVRYDRPSITLLHVRDNRTGEYVMMNPFHHVWNMIHERRIPVAPNRIHEMTLEQALASLESMEDAEGYVFQFDDGDMVKAKCDWYARAHRAVSYLRERDVAVLALNEELDDVKAILTKVGHDLTAVNEVETRLMERLIQIDRETADLAAVGRLMTAANYGVGKKEFAAVHGKHELFRLAVNRMEGKDDRMRKWYGQYKLKNEFGLRSLLSAQAREALEG
ncbi:RNA ligase [Staphylococcus epidermidis]|nr:RNA ligase [Staphylococcus epidermidis]MDH9530797.1 RNA ligase [Staphylococcus epidermidis]